MRQYLIDELRPADYEKIKAYLDQHFSVSEFEGLYWVTLEEEQLTEVQSAHKECQPYYFALELLPDRLACELLVRSKQRIRCHCIQYASETQRNWIIQKMDGIIEKLELIT
jgi:hypothetical protein